MRNFIWAALGVMLSMFAVFLWGGKTASSKYPELDKAELAVRYLSAKNQLRRSSFLTIYPDGKPSQFVAWMFSPLGLAEWPMSEYEAETNPDIREIARTIRMPLLPKGVDIVPDAPKDNSGKLQLVVKSDDARGMIIVAAYANSSEKPVFIQEWELQKTK